ncbi:AzlC family ABC transporter permease [Corynebacterium epidermidicanis]|uniref:Putative branched-chain amino acid permease (Azaleucine resistance) n=1 Tax=Corynebacterium epidermidicanis TaxID=1050174 RepID=A0A0G3GLW2_9CORY|nr:AzlC family ABC transporter permease [Corynebacterium epidermidicanis]AKK02186.1 putative branched-chain amino acid permease (azaleucine resistance) [Corynebacterium epidermidicanis]
MESSTSPLARATKRAGVVWVGVFVLGIGLGVMVPTQGFPWWLAPIISMVIFAGSSEFMLLGLLVASASLGTIALTTFLINFRHLFYGLTYPLEKFRHPGTKLYIIYAMIDEAFALVSTTPPEEREPREMFWIHLGMHIAWVAGSVTGAVAGANLLAGVQGLDFVLVALFVVLAIDSWRMCRDAMTVGLAVAAGLIGLSTGHGNMMLVGMSLLLVALVIRHRMEARHG